MLDPCLLTNLSELQINCQCGDRGSHFNESLSNLLEGLFGLVDRQCGKFSEWGAVLYPSPHLPTFYSLLVLSPCSQNLSQWGSQQGQWTPPNCVTLCMSCQPPEGCNFRAFLQGLLWWLLNKTITFVTKGYKFWRKAQHPGKHQCIDAAVGIGRVKKYQFLSHQFCLEKVKGFPLLFKSTKVLVKTSKIHFLLILGLIAKLHTPNTVIDVSIMG